MIELKIQDEGTCTCHVEGNALDVAAQATVAIMEILKPIPVKLQKAILTVVAMEMLGKELD